MPTPSAKRLGHVYTELEISKLIERVRQIDPLLVEAAEDHDPRQLRSFQEMDPLDRLNYVVASLLTLRSATRVSRAQN